MEEVNLSRGSFVWAKMDKKYWPGMIVDHVDIGRSTTKKGYKWVYWLGDNTISMISIKNIMNFTSNFSLIYGQTDGVDWKNNVFEALRVYGSDYVTNFTNEELINWALDDNFEGVDGCNITVPSFILARLEQIAKAEKCKDVYYIYKKAANSAQRSVIDTIFKKKRPLETMCLSCYSEETFKKHPLLEGCLCRSCHETYFLTMLHSGNDAIEFFCFVCGHVGNMFVCSNYKCTRVICDTCIDDLCGVNAQYKIRTHEKWICFVCSRKITYINGLIKRREDWKENIHMILSDKSEKVPAIHSRQRKLRVLSICDELGGTLNVLERLGIDVEMYYAYEIDPLCIKITKYHFQDKIDYIKGIDDLNMKKLKEMLPIDLLIGRITYRELKDIDNNPDYNNATFLQFYRILSDLNYLSDHHFFWLFECPTVIRVKHKVEMNRMFQSNAAFCTNTFYSARDKKFLWGNLPTLYNKKLLHTTSEADRTTEWKNLPINTLEKLYGYPKDYTNFGYLNEDDRTEIILHTMGLSNLKILLDFLKMYYPLKRE